MDTNTTDTLESLRQLCLKSKREFVAAISYYERNPNEWTLQEADTCFSKQVAAEENLAVYLRDQVQKRRQAVIDGAVAGQGWGTIPINAKKYSDPTE